MRPLFGLSHQAQLLHLEKGALDPTIQGFGCGFKIHQGNISTILQGATQGTCFVLTERSARSPELFNVWRTGYVLKWTAPQESACILDLQGENAST